METARVYAFEGELCEVGGQIVGHDTVIGLLGKTGNAAKTPAHLHYTILLTSSLFKGQN